MASFKVIWTPVGENPLSDAFFEEYQKRTGKKLSHHGLFNEGFIDPDSFRRDPVVIAIMEEKGVQWCNDSSWGRRIYGYCVEPYEIKEFPAIFDGFVEIEKEYEGYGDSSYEKELLKIRYDLLMIHLLDDYLMNGRSREWLQGQRDFINEYIEREGV
jgi:hypothetical protein